MCVKMFALSRTICSLLLLTSWGGCLAEESKVKIVDICREEPSNGTKAYCSCKEQVISCDFSHFQEKGEFEFKLNGWNDNANSNIKRLCFCGGPKKTHFEIQPNVFNGLRRLHRVDFFNMPGIIHVRRAFSQYFSGDLYMENVRVNNIHPLEFGPGDPFTIQDVSGLECCSKISPKIKDVKHPVLHLENVKIGKVSSNGFHDGHDWRTVIMNNVRMNVDAHGIFFNNLGMDVSITNCTFNKTEEAAVRIQNAANILIARNNFTSDADFHTLEIKTSYPSSNLVLLENYFNNGQLASFDAARILSLFNHFSIWDSYTFPNTTYHTDRIYLMAFNVIKNSSHLSEDSIHFSGQKGRSHFLENVLGECSCNLTAIQFPKVLQESRCELHDSTTTCTPLLKDLSSTCKSPSNAVKTSCVGEKALSKINMNYMEIIQNFLQQFHTGLNSSFLNHTFHSSLYQYEVTSVENNQPVPDAARMKHLQDNKSSSLTISCGRIGTALIALTLIWLNQ